MSRNISPGLEPRSSFISMRCRDELCLSLSALTAARNHFIPDLDKLQLRLEHNLKVRCQSVIIGQFLVKIKLQPLIEIGIIPIADPLKPS